MLDLDGAKSYLLVDFDDRDADILSMIESAKAIIYTSTGAEAEKVEQCDNKSLKFLYDITLKIVLKNLWDEKEINGARLKTFYLKLKPLYRMVISNG